MSARAPRAESLDGLVPNADLVAALREQGVGSIAELAALPDDSIKMFQSYGVIDDVQSLKDAMARAKQHQQRLQQHRRQVERSDVAPARKRARGDYDEDSESSSDDSHVNEASEESDYEQQAPDSPRRAKRPRTKPATAPQRRAAASEQKQRAPSPSSRSRPGSRLQAAGSRQREGAAARASSGQLNRLIAAVGSTLAAALGVQGIHILEALVSVDPDELGVLAMAAGVAEDAIVEAQGKAQAALFDGDGSEEGDEPPGPAYVTAESFDDPQPQGRGRGGERRRSGRESRAPRDWEKSAAASLKASERAGRKDANEVDPGNLPACPYAMRENVCWHCKKCDRLETLESKRALQPFEAKHGWTWCNKSTGVAEDGDCFYHCIRLAMATFQRREAEQQGKKKTRQKKAVDVTTDCTDGEAGEITVKMLRGWVAEAATEQTLEHYQAMAAAGIDDNGSQQQHVSDLQAAINASNASGNNAAAAAAGGSSMLDLTGNDADLDAAIAASMAAGGAAAAVSLATPHRPAAEGTQATAGAAAAASAAERQPVAAEPRASSRVAERRRHQPLSSIVGAALAAFFEENQIFTASQLIQIDPNMLDMFAIGELLRCPMTVFMTVFAAFMLHCAVQSAKNDGFDRGGRGSREDLRGGCESAGRDGQPERASLLRRASGGGGFRVA